MPLASINYSTACRLVRHYQDKEWRFTSGIKLVILKKRKFAYFMHLDRNSVPVAVQKGGDFFFLIDQI